MNLPSTLLTIRWLIRDTFRQSLSSRIFWGMLLLSTAAILLCLSLSVSPDRGLRKDLTEHYVPRHSTKGMTPIEIEDAGITVLDKKITLGFGLFDLSEVGGVPLAFRDREQVVRHIQMILSSLIADKFGVMLALLFTAGFLPSFLEPSAVSVLLAKPVPRWALLAGKYLGVLTFVFFQAAVFVFGTWLALGLRTGVWSTLYLLSLPLLMLHFGIFYSFSAFLAVWTRSTVTCAFGAIGFWLLCWAVNFSHHSYVAMTLQGRPPTRLEVLTGVQAVTAVAPTAGVPAGIPWAALNELPQPTPPARRSWLFEAGYWIAPKPADIGILLYDSLQADNYFSQMLEYRTLKRHGAFHAELSILSSLIFTALILAIAGYEFVTKDY